MQLTLRPALSAFVIATAAIAELALAVPSAHAASNHHLVQRSQNHRGIVARDVQSSSSPLLQAAKRANPQRIQRRCRVRPTSSSSTSASTAASSSTGSVSSTQILGGSASSTASSTATSTDSSSAPGSSSTVEVQGDTPWRLTNKVQGKNFFDQWDFWSFADPTHGNVNYVDPGTAWNEGLVQVNDAGQAIMRVNTDDYVGNRKSVRLHSKQVVNKNSLVVLDAEHMPTGCGTWPAWWMNGPNWPAGGEIDILEGVHDDTTNHATLHTTAGCTASSDASHPSTGQLTNAQCGFINGDNSGCGYADVSTNTGYGAGFNSAKGGVYVMQWVDSGISVWYFPRGAIPADLVAEKPMPWTWPSPFARWSTNTCNVDQFFRDHITIFNTTFCGDWAGATWQSSGCADKTGYSSCAAFVSEKGSAFHEAYWTVNYVKYFQQ
ncbi:hypothetical protein FRC14_008116 [Serendipita sp. 396]|nr:hypothetical protein FRC14_008116 [Serendipita sp. 396]KAG8787085.1 hypothetical protein FRC15_010025 [Serendipita sp. 397]KAG8828747.1 hypothetical protein FRC19_000135 [Serendipita sp. 401]KAG8849024.1 hypothetical protein FRB91_010300 [Serendipita sp. 411]KAG9057342.1 hypothetical protein FS842_007255 [Serendipita sp. 407]